MVRKCSTAFRRLPVTVTGVMALLITSPAMADAYLDALKAEARSEKQVTLPTPADAVAPICAPTIRCRWKTG